jgi:type II secretory pathway pseudopilin PulG
MKRSVDAVESRGEAGMTLIELLVYMVLSVVVLLIVGGFLVNSLTTSRNVRSVTQATTAAQLISTSVQSGVRNASGIKLVSESADGSQLVVARTATRAAAVSWICQAWYFSAADKAIYTKTAAATGALVLPASGAAGSWTLLSDGVAPMDAATSVFHVTSYSVGLSFGVEASDRAPVRIDTTAFLRTTDPEGAPCF